MSLDKEIKITHHDHQTSEIINKIINVSFSVLQNAKNRMR